MIKRTAPSVPGDENSVGMIGQDLVKLKTSMNFLKVDKPMNACKMFCNNS